MVEDETKVKDGTKSGYGSEEKRVEYQAVVGYHTAIVSSRFTIAGLYVAGVGFLVAAVLEPDTNWPARLAGSGLALWLTLCLWVLELRSRALYKNLGRRGVAIEHRYWGLTGKELCEGFFSRQYKEPPECDSHETEAAPQRPEPDRPHLSWSGKPMSARLSRFVSHSAGLDLLYVGGIVFWSGSVIIAAYKML